MFASMRRAILVALIALDFSCANSAAPTGEALLIIDTDAPVPALAGHFRIDLYSADGLRWLDSRDIARLDPRDWPVSLSIYDPSTTSSRKVLVRIRIYPEGKVRD